MRGGAAGAAGGERANGGAGGTNDGAPGSTGGAAGTTGGAAGQTSTADASNDSTATTGDASTNSTRDGSPPDASVDAACNGGTLCTPATGADPCGVFITDCSTGTPSCVRIGNQLAGVSCGTNQVCTPAAACVACQAGADCSPGSAPCKVGTQSCSGGQPVCTATATDRADGASCGVNRVCHTGLCGDCAVNSPCVPPQGSCFQGRTSCATGLAACESTGQLPAGTACPNGVCDSTGTCVACQAGLACTPANSCHSGSLSCATGSGVCVDSGNSLADNVFCAPDELCTAGTCVSAGNWISRGEDNRTLTGGWVYTFATPGATITPFTSTTVGFVPSAGGMTGKDLAVSGTMSAVVPDQNIFPAAALGFTFTTVNAPIDAGARGSGIQFFVSNAGTTALSLEVSALDVRTDAEFSICSTSNAPTVVDRCFDYPQAICVVPPNGVWSFCRFLWADFVRPDWGNAGAGLPVDSHAITAIQFLPPATPAGEATRAFQFAIDDVSFVP